MANGPDSSAQMTAQLGQPWAAAGEDGEGPKACPSLLTHLPERSPHSGPHTC